MTHYADITNEKTQPCRMFSFLLDNIGQSFTTRQLSNAVNSYAPSTVISQVRAQLPSHFEIKTEAKRRGKRTLYYYTMLEV
jgi:hypothetical protein